MPSQMTLRELFLVIAFISAMAWGLGLNDRLGRSLLIKRVESNSVTTRIYWTGTKEAMYIDTGTTKTYCPEFYSRLLVIKKRIGDNPENAVAP